jgi:hypothetical protein
MLKTINRSKQRTINRRAYLTKRRTESAARRGLREAAENTMQIMGYAIEAHDGWVVRKFPDGTIEKIKPIATRKKIVKIILD